MTNLKLPILNKIMHLASRVINRCKNIENLKLEIGNWKFSQGFTMVEMLVYMVILILFVSVLSLVFRQIVDVQLNSQSTSSVEQDGRFILARLTHDMQSAQTIVTPATPGQQGNTLQITVNSVNYTYALNNGNLQLTNNNGTDNLNSTLTTLSAVSFKRIGNGDVHDTIRFSFTITSVIKRGSGAETRTYQTTLGLQ